MATSSNIWLVSAIFPLPVWMQLAVGHSTRHAFSKAMVPIGHFRPISNIQPVACFVLCSEWSRRHSFSGRERKCTHRENFKWYVATEEYNFGFTSTPARENAPVAWTDSEHPECS